MFLILFSLIFLLLGFFDLFVDIDIDLDADRDVDGGVYTDRSVLIFRLCLSELCIRDTLFLPYKSRDMPLFFWKSTSASMWLI